MELTPAAVHELVKQCLCAPEEPHEPVIVRGIMRAFAFHSVRIAEHSNRIAALLAELPNEFQPGPRGGGGWTFLNACNDRHGNLWTGDHATMEALFCLGIAAGRARWLMDRDMWDVLPGGMPYVAVLA